MADWSTNSTSSTTEPSPYPLTYHYSDDILTFIELSNGSFQSAYAYHYDMTNIGRYFVEFEDGSIISTKNRAPYVPLKPTNEYFRLVENPVNPYNADLSNWDENFPALNVGENVENNNGVQVFDKSPQRTTQDCTPTTDGTNTSTMANWSTGSTSSTTEPEPYPVAYHYFDDILTFAELSNGSFQSAYAYHYDMTNIGRYFVEFEDGSIVSTKNRAPYVPLKPTDEYFRLVENPVNAYDADLSNLDENFPALKVEAGENAENNNGVQVFDTSPQRTTHTSQETEPKPTGKGDKKGVEVSEEQVDRIREELSCGICLEICFEPSTTSCGHSFCGECLKSAADICGTRCPKCRHLISNGSSYPVNTGLWNIIQLLFPKEVESRKAGGALNGGEGEHQSSVIIVSHSNISRSRTTSITRRRRSVNFRTRTELPSQDEDAELAWRLQSEEFR